MNFKIASRLLHVKFDSTKSLFSLPFTRVILHQDLAEPNPSNITILTPLHSTEYLIF